MTMWMPLLAPGRPKYLALADSIDAALCRGELLPGQRLPTHRDLAEALGVTVGTVTRGYAEAARRGAVRGEVGRGTVAAPAGQASGPWWGGEGAGGIDLGLVTGMYGLDPDLGAALQDLPRRVDVQELLRYQPSGGMARHREAGSRWCARYGVQAGPERVLVTAGGQHGLLVLLSVLFRPGDRVAVGCLNYPGLLSAAGLLGLRLVPVALDAEGVVPESLDEACSRDTVRGVYLMPGAHNPTSASPSADRQERLAQVARARGLQIIEDAAYALTAEEPLPTVAALAPERTSFIASVSKAVAGGLRVAFVAAPPDMVERLELGITGTTWMASPLCVEIASGWLADGTAEAVLRRKRAEATRRMACARKLLCGLDCTGLRQGYFLWLRLPEPWRASDFERAAGLRGVTVIGADAFAVGQTAAPAAVRVSLSAARGMDELERGLAVLAQLVGETPRPVRAIV